MSTDFVAKGASGQHSKLLFVVGVGRSGTSLLHSMLSSHPDIAGVSETGLLRRYFLKRQTDNKLSDSQISDMARFLMQDERFARLGIDNEKVKEIFSADVCTLENAYRQLMERAANRDGVKYILDKDPNLIAQLFRVARRFEDARFVHVYRDPRDVLVSKMKAEWSSKYPFPRHIVANAVHFRSGRVFQRHEAGADRICEVRYESLISQPETELRRILSFLGLPYAKVMLSYTEAASRLVDRTEISWKRETLGPLLKSNHGKWRAELSAFQVALTEDVCSEAMIHGEYDWAERKSLSPFHRFVAKAYAFLLNVGTVMLTSIGNNR